MVHGPTQEVPIQHFPFVKIFAGSLNNVVASAEAYPKDTSLIITISACSFISNDLSELTTNVPQGPSRIDSRGRVFVRNTPIGYASSTATGAT